MAYRSATEGCRPWLAGLQPLSFLADCTAIYYCRMTQRYSCNIINATLSEGSEVVVLSNNRFDSYWPYLVVEVYFRDFLSGA